MLTITNRIKTYLGSQDEALLLKKSNAAREMMKKKMERIEAIQASIRVHKEINSNTSKQDVPDKKQSTDDEAKVEEDEQQNLFTDKNYFNPNSNFTHYRRDHKHK